MHRVLVAALFGLCLLVQARPAAAQAANSQPRAFLTNYCVSCHNARTKTAGLVLDPSAVDHPEANADQWERVIRKLRLGAMPPRTTRQPESQDRARFVSWLEG